MKESHMHNPTPVFKQMFDQFDRLNYYRLHLVPLPDDITFTFSTTDDRHAL